jgi:diacylglycerol kinase (ATP)
VPARRVDLVLNRAARRLREDDGLAEVLVRAAREAGVAIHETRSVADLAQVAGELAARGTDSVVLAGGDGSYMAGTSALARAFDGRLPPIAFAPGGTASTVLRNWGYRGPTHAYARRVVLAAAIGAGEVTTRPTLRVRDDRGRDFVGFIFGAGLVASFFDAYYASPVQGYGGAAAIVARIFAGSFVGSGFARRILDPAPMALTVDGEECDKKAFSLVAASVVRNLGLHMMLLYRAAEANDAVHVVASPLGARALGPQMPRVLRGQRLRGEGHVDTLAKEVRLRFAGNGPGAYVLDGELLRAGQVWVGPGPVIQHLSA